MQEFLKTPWVITVGWSLGVLGWIVGFFSGLVQFKSYAEQRNLEKGYTEILEQAKRDWEAKYTEEQIRILTQELMFLEERIDRGIPKQARRIFLESQLQDLRDSIGQNFTQYTQIAEEIDDLASQAPLPPELRGAIEKSIMPAYLARQRQAQGLWWLLIVALSLLAFLNWDFLMDLLHTEYRLCLIALKDGIDWTSDSM